jgi:hypothetical protein
MSLMCDFEHRTSAASSVWFIPCRSRMRRIRLASLLATDSTGFTFLPKGFAL